MDATRQKDGPWYRRRSVIAGFTAVLAFVLGVGVGLGDDSSKTAELETEVAELVSERRELEEELASSPSVEEVEQLTKRIAELESELDQVREEAVATAADLADREEQIASQEEAIAELESTLREQERELAELDDAESEPAAQPEPEGGCQPGQVNINTASVEELQRIYEIGPARAEQIVQLRPFNSVDDLIRVSGIAEGRLGGIKAQGLACVD